MLKWEDVLNVTPSYFFSFDSSGKITRINDFLLDHIGYSRDEIVGHRKFEDLLTVGSRIFFHTHFYPIIKMTRKATEIFLSFRTSAGAELPVLMNVRMDADTGEFFCGGLQIEQRNRFEKEILEAKKAAENALLENVELQRLKSELEQSTASLERKLTLLARKNTEHRQINEVLSHDVQEQLRKISIFGDLMSQQQTDEVQAGHLSKILKSVANARELVVSMQQFLSMDNLQLTLVNLVPDNFFSEVFASADGSDFSASWELGGIRSIRADYRMLSRLFEELVSNSVKFRKPEEELKIHVEVDSVMQNIFRETEGRYKYEEFIRIIYKDNGIGFEPRFSESIFQIFRKAGVSSKSRGMGLAICRKITDLHNGLISARSDGENGSTFTILLPVNSALQ